MSLSEYVGCVFFFKQKTAYEMRISDWSSDVCSSDLFRTITHENVVGNPRLTAQWGGGDRLRTLQPFEIERMRLLTVVGTQEIGQSIVVARVTDERGLQRIEFERFFTELGIHGIESGRELRRNIGKGSCRERGCQYG